MAEDLLRSLKQLNKMLKSTTQGEMVAAHLEKSEEADDAENPYSIGNGAYIKVSEDNMTAWIYLNPPKEGEKYYTKSDIEEFIYEHGIMCGLHESNIAAIAKKHVYEREIVIAKGQHPKQGNDGYFEFFFDTVDKRKPEVREDGTVDYAAMSKLSSVEEGEKIAEYHPATESEPGFDIYGKNLPAKPSKNLVPLRGRGVTNEGNPNIYYATATGKVDYKNGHIDIKNVHEIRGDVDMIIGKIEFFGDVHIYGNVEAGVVIKASRNVTIDGVVSEANIFAGGDITIARGIQGAEKGHVISNGSVFAKFIEHCHVEAKENVRSNTYINAEVYAGGMVLAEGKDGLILGGNVRGLRGVTAKCIGNDTETKTIVASGYSQENYENYVNAYQDESKTQEALSDVVEQLSALVKKKRLEKVIDDASLDDEITILNEKKEELFEALDKVRNEKSNLEALIEKGKGSVIVCNDKIYRGTTIVVEGTPYNVPENTCFMRYKNEGGSIITSVIV